MPEFEIQMAAAKIGKYAMSESGDTLEMIERPQGGVSAVLADGQRSGKAAKSISNIVVRKAIALLAEGVRDGAVARAAHDYLRTIRQGKVSATLNIVSVDLETETIVVSRNSHCPVVMCVGSELTLLDQESEAIGIRTWTKPLISELPIRGGTYVVVFTDGVVHAGRHCGEQMDVARSVENLAIGAAADRPISAQALADALLAEAIACDLGRPGDDISILVVAVLPAPPGNSGIRRMQASFPIQLIKSAQYVQAG